MLKKPFVQLSISYATVGALSATIAASVNLATAGAGQAQEQQFVLHQPAQASPPAAPKVAGRAGRARAVRPVKKPPHFEKLVLCTDEMFEPSKDRLTAAGEAQLKGLIPTLRASLDCHPLKIVAYIDNRGFESYNENLTQRQAQRVKDFFVAHGLTKATSIVAKGGGSAQAQLKPSVKLPGNPAARFRVVEISIDYDDEIEPEKVAAKAEPMAEPVEGAVKGQSEVTPMALPPELQEALVDSSETRPVTEEDLMPSRPNISGDQTPLHKTNTDEWGGGGSDFGNRPSFFGGEPVGINVEGKRVVKVTPTEEQQAKQRRETIEAQNEFGLWRDP
jgi:outer membrane protein OmpA-like peptidoglycan-associated protein